MSVVIEEVYEGGLHCKAVHGPSGNELVTDAPTDNGGKGEAFSPTDLVATALGACILTVMGLMAKRHDMNIDGTKVRVVKEMTATPVRRIGELHVTVSFPKDHQLSETDLDRLKHAASVCPVKQSLHPDTKVTIEYA